MQRNTLRVLSFVARCVVLGLAAAFVLSVFAPRLVQRLRGGHVAAVSSVAGMPAGRAGAIAATPASARMQGPISYADAVARASPAVVNIYANKITTVRQYRLIPDPLTQRLFGAIAAGPAYKQRQQNLGSGVIFSPDGYVLTNNHVIKGADDIQVLLDDGRVAQARVIGTDAETDLAVLKIAASNLPTIAIADKGTPDVGDVVLAIGNPFGIGKTVTMGIVSATGRQLRLSAYEDFIQTDAAINAGNSGGALVNSLGELVGINTAIYRQSGNGSYNEGAEGIGFAIPVATAKAVLDQIIKHGMVVRGWLGAEYTDVPLARGATALQRGVMVLELYSGGPAAQAGLRPGDVLLKLDGSDIVNQADLRNREAALAPGTRVHIDGVREGQPFSVVLTMAQRPAPDAAGA